MMRTVIGGFIVGAVLFATLLLVLFAMQPNFTPPHERIPIFSR